MYIFLLTPSNVIAPPLPTTNNPEIYPPLPAITGEDIDVAVINVPLPPVQLPLANKLTDALASVFAVFIAAVCAALAAAEPESTALPAADVANN